MYGEDYTNSPYMPSGSMVDDPPPGTYMYYCNALLDALQEADASDHPQILKSLSALHAQYHGNVYDYETMGV